MPHVVEAEQTMPFPIHCACRKSAFPGIRAGIPDVGKETQQQGNSSEVEAGEHRFSVERDRVRRIPQPWENLKPGLDMRSFSPKP